MNDCRSVRRRTLPRAGWGPTENPGRTSTKKEKKKNGPSERGEKKKKNGNILCVSQKLCSQLDAEDRVKPFTYGEKGVGWFITRASQLNYSPLFIYQNEFIHGASIICIYMKYFNVSSSMFGFPLVPVCSSSTERRRVWKLGTAAPAVLYRTVAPSFFKTIKTLIGWS